MEGNGFSRMTTFLEKEMEGRAVAFNAFISESKESTENLNETISKFNEIIGIRLENKLFQKKQILRIASAENLAGSRDHSGNITL